MIYSPVGASSAEVVGSIPSGETNCAGRCGRGLKRLTNPLRRLTPLARALRGAEGAGVEKKNDVHKRGDGGHRTRTRGQVAVNIRIVLLILGENIETC